MNQLLKERYVPKIYKQQYVADMLKIDVSHLNQILLGKRHASWALARRIGKLTNSNPVIWVDDTPNASENRQLALLREELRIREARLVA